MTFLDGHSWHGRILFYRPTVLADAGPSIPAYEQEVFGPVATVTPFGADDDASDSAYGLSLVIFTADVARGPALADRIPTGTARAS